MLLLELSERILRNTKNIQYALVIIYSGTSKLINQPVLKENRKIDPKKSFDKYFLSRKLSKTEWNILSRIVL